METATRTATPTDHRPALLADVELQRAWVYDDRPASPDTDHEADKIQWVDPATDLDCLIVRSPVMGNLCGYVGVGRGHPAYLKPYQDLDIDVHGGLTYGERCQEGHPHEGVGVCHLPFAGRSDDIWWLGFDCAHGGQDRFPWESAPMFPGGIYKTQDYVADEVFGLARQLAAMA